MDVIFQIQSNEIKKDPDNSYYNNICWEFKNPKFGFTHFYEIYDDESNTPVYEFGILENDKFIWSVTGEGDPIDDTKIGWSGVYTEVRIHRPEHIIKVYN